MLAEREKKRRDIKFMYLFSYATDEDLNKIKDGCEEQVVFPNVGVSNSSTECTVLDTVTAQGLQFPTGIFASLVNFFKDKASSLVCPLSFSSGSSSCTQTFPCRTQISETQMDAITEDDYG
jgi:hypothetical protein